MSEFYATYPHLLSPRSAMRASSSSSSVRSQQTPNQHNQTTPRARQASNLSLALGRNSTQSLGGLGGAASAPNPSASASSSSLGLGGKLMGLLDRQKYAIFQIDLTLNDLANVPQLEGEFAVRWRFRGKRPKARDAVHRKSPPFPPLVESRYTEPPGIVTCIVKSSGN